MVFDEASTLRDGRESPARLLVVSTGLSGLLYSSIELARRLAVAGHHVTFAGPGPVRGLVELHGLDFFAVEPSGYPEFLQKDRNSSYLRRFHQLRLRRIEAVRSLRLEPFLETVRNLDPDLILLDGEMHEQIVAVMGLGLPVALLNTFPSIWRQPGMPPPHVTVRPGIGWRGTRTAISAYWLALRLRKLLRRTAQRMQRVGCDRVSILRHLAAEAGFDIRWRTDHSQWLIPFSYRETPYLSLHAREFEFPHRPPDNVHYVGPMVLESRAEQAASDEERAALEAILERRRRSAGRSRLIYAGFGSVFSTDPDFVRRLCSVVTGRPEWELILSLSGRMSPADLGQLPERAHVFSWVPQIRVLNYADAVVTHGGINTLDECVLAGVPMLVYCGGETDMAGNTARVVHHGIGLAGDRRRDRPQDICKRLDLLLRETSFVDNVSHLRERYEAYERERIAARVVQSLLRREQSRGRVLEPTGGR